MHFRFMQFYIYPEMDKIVKIRFNDTKIPYVGDLQKQVDLTFVNGHCSLAKHEPLPVNVIPVAGLQIRNPQPLDDVSSYKFNF